MIPDLKCVMLLAGLAVAAPIAAGAAADGGLNGYDFSYSIAGDARATPIQVFDDGAHTFFQFKAAENVPAIFLYNRGRQELAQITARSPYIVVSGVGQRFSLRSGAAVASVDYVGGRRNDPVLPTARDASEMSVPKRAPAPAEDAERAMAMIQDIRAQLDARGRQPDVAPEARLTPGREDPAAKTAASKDTTAVPFHRGKATLGPLGTRTMAKIIQPAIVAEAVMITGRGDSDNLALGADRAMALRNYLVNRGVPVGRIRLAEGQAAHAATSKDVFLSDVTLVAPRAASAHAESAPSAAMAAPANWLPLASATIAMLDEGKISREAAAEILERMLATRRDSKPALQVASKPVWEISPSDGTLRSAFARWAGAAGWQLSWDAPVDYPIKVRASFQGSFDEAVGSVASALETADVPLQVTFYRANKVLRVVAATGAAK